MRKSIVAKVLAPVLVLGLGLTACGTSAQTGGGSGSGSGETVTGLRMMVPNTPGSGYDLTARAAAKAMEDADLARNVEVFNVPGAGGTVGLQRVVNEQGNGKLLMQMGLGVVGAAYTNNSEATLQDTTPIAKLIEEAEAVVVPAAIAVPDARPAGGRVEGRTRSVSRWVAARRPAVRTTWPRTCWRRRSGSTRSRSTSSPTTAAASC